MVQTALSAAEMGARAEVIFRERIQGRIPDADRRKYLLIDIDSGDYEVGPDDLLIEERLLQRHPAAVMVLLRADGGPAGRFGGM